MSSSLSAPIIPEDVSRSVILPESQMNEENVVHPAFSWLRKHMPVGLARVDGYDPVWIISSHQLIKEVLQNAELFHSADINIFFNQGQGTNI